MVLEEAGGSRYVYEVTLIMFFIPLTNPFNGSILFKIVKIGMKEPQLARQDLCGRIDPVNGFNRGIKNTCKITISSSFLRF